MLYLRAWIQPISATSQVVERGKLREIGCFLDDQVKRVFMRPYMEDAHRLISVTLR